MQTRTTVGDRILLYLRAYVRFDDAVDCPLEITQPGVARALAVSRAHAALELKRQMTAGKVAMRLAHVRGSRHRRKVYTLTLAGHRRVALLLQQVRGRSYLVHFPDGDRRDLLGTDALAVLQSSGLRESEALLRLLETDAIRVDGGAPFPAPAKLVGRVRERASLFEFLGSGRGILWVTGPPGIGKTALVATEVAARHIPAIWIRCVRGDAREAVIRRMGRFLEARFRPELSQGVDRQEFGPEALDALQRNATGLTVILDDAEKAPDAVAFVRQAARDWRVVVISSEPQPNPVEPVLTLPPLTAEDVEVFLEAMPPSERLEVARAGQGVPARLVLACQNRAGPSTLEGLLAAIEERDTAALRIACVFDPPFPAEAQRSSYLSLHALARMGIVVATADGFEVPGVVREHVLRSLDRGVLYGLHSRAASYFAEDSNAFREGLHLLAADRPHEAASRLVSARERLLSDGTPHALLTLLEECARRGADPEPLQAFRMEAALAAGYEKTAVTLATALRSSGNPLLRLRAILTQGRAHLSNGDPAAATFSFAEAKRLSGELEDLPSQGRAFRGLADAQRAMGNPHGALELFGKAERLFTAAKESEEASEVHADRCRTAIEAGEREGLDDLRTLAKSPGAAGARARRHLHELVDTAAHLQHPPSSSHIRVPPEDWETESGHPSRPVGTAGDLEATTP